MDHLLTPQTLQTTHLQRYGDHDDRTQTRPVVSSPVNLKQSLEDHPEPLINRDGCVNLSRCLMSLSKPTLVV